jgi:hypothetical protein
MKQILCAANHRLGANLTATEPTGLLGRGPDAPAARIENWGAGRARSDLLWANLTKIWINKVVAQPNAP